MPYGTPPPPPKTGNTLTVDHMSRRLPRGTARQGSGRQMGLGRACVPYWRHRGGSLGGVFAQRGHSAGTAPIIALLVPATPLKTTPPTEACMIHSKQHRGCRMQDPGTRGYRWWKTDDFSHSAGTAHSAPPWTKQKANESVTYRGPHTDLHGSSGGCYDCHGGQGRSRE